MHAHITRTAMLCLILHTVTACTTTTTTHTHCTQTDACTADGLCASCTSEADPDTSELHGNCNATANDATLRDQFNTTCTASGTLLDKAITCIAGAFAKDCKGVANSSGTLKVTRLCSYKHNSMY
jgi:hypothetical protein